MTSRARIRSRGHAPARGALITGLCLLLAGVLAGGVSGASVPVFTPDHAAAELMRLLNGERTAHGLPALAIDSFLAVQTRDGAIDCPNNGGTMEGRAKDMATHDYFSHTLRLCPSYGIFQAMSDWGYSSSKGEIIAMNGGYGYAATPYQFGCDLGAGNCTGGTTQAPGTVAKASRQFLSSSGHRNIVLSDSYDRFACGAWSVSGSAYYACLYAFGPGTSVPDMTAPSMTGLTARAVVTSRSRGFLSQWSATDNRAVTGYRIWIRKDGGAWSPAATQRTTSKSFSGLSNGTWYIRVQAHDSAGNWSAVRQATVVLRSPAAGGRVVVRP